MSKVERGQFSTLLRRYLGMTGTSDVVDELAPEMSAVFVLEAERPEWEFLKGARLLGMGQTVPALAANFGAIRFRNPTNSGVVAIFSSLNAGPGFNPAPAAAVITITHGAQVADQATVQGYGIRDGRQTPIGGAVIQSQGYAAVGGNSIGAAIIPATSSFQLITPANPVVLVPGWALNVGIGFANLDLVVGAQWIEKRLDALET